MARKVLEEPSLRIAGFVAIDPMESERLRF